MAGLAVIWIAFSLVAFPLTYKAFVGVALVMIAWSLVWCACLVYAGCRSLPEQLRNFIEALDDGASIMLVYSLMGSIILAYGRFIDNNIRVWYVDAVMYVGCVVTLVMFLALVQKKRTSSAGSQQSAKS